MLCGVETTRSLYVICVLLCVEGGLCGFTQVPAKAGQAFQMMGPGDGSLEEGLLLALQSIGDVGLDAFVLKRDWPPVDNARWAHGVALGPRDVHRAVFGLQGPCVHVVLSQFRMFTRFHVTS